MIYQHVEKIETLSAAEEGSVGMLVSRRTDAIAHALEPLRLKEKTRKEIAFAVAEISPELEEMLSLVKKAQKRRPLTHSDLVSLQRMAYHWPQHLGDLKRYLARAFDELDPD